MSPSDPVRRIVIERRQRDKDFARRIFGPSEEEVQQLARDLELAQRERDEALAEIERLQRGGPA